jgi:hypothetical protein
MALRGEPGVCGPEKSFVSRGQGLMWIARVRTFLLGSQWLYHQYTTGELTVCPNRRWWPEQGCTGLAWSGRSLWCCQGHTRCDALGAVGAGSAAVYLPAAGCWC